MAKKKKVKSIKLPHRSISISWSSIDDVINELLELKKKGYTEIDGVDCQCYYKCCSCTCSSHMVK